MLQQPSDHVCYAFNLIRLPDTNDMAEAARLVAANWAVYHRVRTAGGTLYPVSALKMSHDDRPVHFGTAWSQLREAKQRFDPGIILTPGYDVFG